MLLEIFVIVFAILLLYVVSSRKPKNYPPGPFSLPIFGNLLHVGLESYKGVMGMRKKYGDIIAIDLGTRRAVFINEYKLIKEAFNLPAFNGRCKLQHWAEPETGILGGILFTSGKSSAEQRKFTFSYIQSGLRNGVSLETLVTNEVMELTRELKKACGQSIQTKQVFNIPTVNSLWTIVAGQKYSLDDPAFAKMIEHNTNLQQSTLFQGFLLFYPKFSEIFPKISGYQHLRKNWDPITDFLRNIIDEHKETYVEGIQRDLIDAYLCKMKVTTDPSSSFYENTGERNLRFVLHDLFMTGAETVASTLCWIVFLMAHHPEIQKNLIKTIHSYTKNGVSISLADRPRLIYIEAIINEVLRYSALAPLGGFHETLEDVEFHGYKIPKGTAIVANQYATLHDPEVWGDPQNFRPERFLSEDETKLIRHGALIPFGSGTRVCPGESFARDELFLFTTNLFQNFKVEFDPSLPSPPLKYKLGTINVPIDHHVIFHNLFE